MQMLNDFESGDAVDLYRDVQAILRPKYYELAEDFLFFLKEKEASAVGQLMPWLELQARVKFLRKLEVYLKDQPSQLKKIYNTMQDLAKSQDVTTEKIKTTIVPMLKGNAILMDFFLQNFRDERPPPRYVSFLFSLPILFVKSYLLLEKLIVMFLMLINGHKGDLLYIPKSAILLQQNMLLYLQNKPTDTDITLILVC